MKLSTLLAPWTTISLPDIEINHIENDSRKLGENGLFFAYPGAQVDGRKFIQAVLDKGAAAVLYEEKGAETWLASIDTSVPLIAIDGLFEKMGAIAARFYEAPSSKMKVIGVTGTNGKTTIAYQLALALNALGEQAFYIGTIGFGQPHQIEPLPNTTPDGLCLQRLFYQCLKAGARVICMEVSSHALAEGRVSGCHFTQAIFTNLTHEHLDFHGTMQAYQEAKARLFAWPGLKTAILNADDQASQAMQAAIPKGALTQVITYSLEQDSASLFATSLRLMPTQVQFELKTPSQNAACTLKLVGRFNVYNSLAVVGSLMALGYPFDVVMELLPKLEPVKGRMELVHTQPAVLVDFAHTPDAFLNALQSIKKTSEGRLIVVFGCGGNRDTQKRPKMGKIASELADIIVLTNDNPRNEPPEQIAAEIRSGIHTDKPVYEILSRAEAIAKALNLANKEDTVLIAGKGHEAYQQIGAEKQAFSDQETVKAWFESNQSN